MGLHELLFTNGHQELRQTTKLYDIIEIQKKSTAQGLRYLAIKKTFQRNHFLQITLQYFIIQYKMCFDTFIYSFTKIILQI